MTDDGDLFLVLKPESAAETSMRSYTQTEQAEQNSPLVEGKTVNGKI